MHKMTDPEQAIKVGKKTLAASRAWLRLVDHEEATNEGVKVSIGAAWTKEGVLVIFARGYTAARIDGLLRDEDIAQPQYRERGRPPE